MDVWSGFVITPGEIEGRINGIDRAVQDLDRQIQQSTEPRVDERFKEAWRGFTQRWQITRDSYRPWTARLFATRIWPVLEDYQRAVGRWLDNFQSRVGGAASAPPQAEPSPSLFETPLQLHQEPSLNMTGILAIASLGALSAWLVMRKSERPT